MKIEIIKRSNFLIENDFAELRNIWLDIIKEQPHSYFHSWPWITHWLTKLPLDVEILLLKITIDNSVAVCLLGYNKETRHGFINSDSYYLHYTGQEPFDHLTLEYNQILTRNPTPDLLQALLMALPRGWDELHLPALDKSCFPANCLERLPAGHTVLTKQQRPSYFVDLSVLDEVVDSFLNLLSKKTRSSIRQSMRGLSLLGQLHLIPSTTLEAALATYDDLVEMHQESWQNRGMLGAFSTSWFYDFHKDLIKSRFAFGEIQLLRVVCGDDTLGCLYNMVHQGVVFHYQCGYNYKKFKKYSSGLVCHTLAIPYNAGLGHKTYDFLAGDSEYKRRLSTHANQMVWCIIQKPRFRFLVENFGKTIKAWMRKQQSKIYF